MATSPKSTSRRKPPDARPSWYVSVPLSDLQELMEAARKVPELEHEVSRCVKQLDAFRATLTQMMDKYQELYKML